MPIPSVTYTFTNSTTADATEVNQNYTDLVNSLTDGLKDLTINALTANGAAAFNGTVTLGNATGDDVTVTGYVASTVIPKTTVTHDLGTTTLFWNKFYIGHILAKVNDGTIYDEGDPPYSFTGDTDTGMFSEGADQLNLACAGVAQYSQTTTAITTTVPFLSQDGTAAAPAYTFSGDTNTGVYRIGVDNIGFSTGGTVRGQVTSAGVWSFGGIATAYNNIDHSSYGRFNVFFPGANGRMDYQTNSVTGTIEFIRFRDGDETACGSIDVNTDANTTAFTTTSDARLKHKLETFDAMSLVAGMKPHKYERISVPDVKEYGLIAQELFEVFPQAVTRGDMRRNRDGSFDKDGVWGIDYGKLTGVLCKAIQELLARIEKLEKKPVPV